MNNVKDIVKSHCRGNIVAYFGSQAGAELDLFWLSNRGVQSISTSVNDVANLVREVAKCGIGVILKHEHRVMLNNNTQLHLLFYPSEEHLIFAEQPSFISNVYIEGTVISGDLNSLQTYSDTYASQKEVNLSCCKKYNQQLIAYDQVAISTYLYLTANSPLMPYKVARENLLYVLRYFGFEIIKCSENAIIKKGDWAVENILHKLRPLKNTKRLIDLIFEAQKENHNMDRNVWMGKLFEEYFLIRDSMYKKLIN